MGQFLHYVILLIMSKQDKEKKYPWAILVQCGLSLLIMSKQDKENHYGASLALCDLAHYEQAR